MRRPLTLALLALLALLAPFTLPLTGCATTRGWEREALARPAMDPDGDPERVALREHVQGTREGALGGMGGGGGGCGCN